MVTYIVKYVSINNLIYINTYHSKLVKEKKNKIVEATSEVIAVFCFSPGFFCFVYISCQFASQLVTLTSLELTFPEVIKINRDK